MTDSSSPGAAIFGGALLTGATPAERKLIVAYAQARAIEGMALQLARERRWAHDGTRAPHDALEFIRLQVETPYHLIMQMRREPEVRKDPHFRRAERSGLLHAYTMAAIGLRIAGAGERNPQGVLDIFATMLDRQAQAAADHWGEHLTAFLRSCTPDPDMRRAYAMRPRTRGFVLRVLDPETLSRQSLADCERARLAA